MNRSLLILVFVAALLACKDNKKQQVQAPPNDDVAPTVTNPLATYSTFITGIDTTNVNSISSAAKKFDELFGGADSLSADSGFVIFSGFYDRMNNYLNEQHIKDPANYEAYISEGSSVSAKKTAKADEWVRKLKENGFKLAMTEGSIYIKQDRTFLAKYFYPHISATMKEYLVQVNKENEEGFIEDAGLVITPLQLAERIIWWENFIKEHPAFYFIKQIKQAQKGNLTFLLEGIDNTPLLDYDSKKLNKEFEQAYDYVLKNYPQSSTASILKPYYRAVIQKDKKRMQRLLQQYKKQEVIYDYSG